MQPVGASDSRLEPYSEFSQSQVCPCCGQPVVRLPRRWLDRMWSVLVPVRRYACRGFGCNWEGNLRWRDVRGLMGEPVHGPKKTLFIPPSQMGP